MDIATNHMGRVTTASRTDTAGADRPMGIFTGDCIFVGDVGRPDLLEKAAKVEGTMEASARQLYHSVQRFQGLPEFLQVWPGHGAGSACGRSLGAVPQSSLGYEKLFNWAFAEQTEDAFVRSVLADQPERECIDVQAIAERHLAEVIEKIASLQSLRAELDRIARCCAGGSIADCRILETLKT